MEKHGKQAIEKLHPGCRVGDQIKIRIEYEFQVDIFEVNVIPDYIVEIIDPVTFKKRYKVYDFKTSEKDLVTMEYKDFEKHLTKYQKEGFPRIDMGQDQPGGYLSATPIEANARRFFGADGVGVEIELEKGVTYYVNPAVAKDQLPTYVVSRSFY